MSCSRAVIFSAAIPLASKAPESRKSSHAKLEVNEAIELLITWSVILCALDLATGCIAMHNQ
jgi:hypothetical protein